MSKRFTLILIVLLLMVKTGVGQTSEVLSLDQAIEIALQNNKNLENAALEIEKNEKAAKANRTRLFPSLNFEAIAGRQLSDIDFTFEQGAFGTYPNVGPIPDRDTTISTPARPTAVLTATIAQPITRLPQLKLKVKQLELETLIAAEEKRTAEQELIKGVRQIYYSIQQTTAAIESAEEILSLNRELDRLSEQYFVQQVALKGDYLQAHSQLAKSEYDLRTLQNKLIDYKEQLNVLLDRDVLQDFSVDPVTEALPQEIDITSARNMALQLRPDRKQSDLKLQQAELDRRAKKSEWIPEINLLAQYTSLQNFDSLLPSGFGSVGISMSWEFFDWGRKRYELAQKDIAIKQAKNSKRDIENSILKEVGEKFRRLEEARQFILVARMNRDTQIESLRVATNRLKTESSLLKDTLQAQSAVEQSNSEFQQALLAFWNARAELQESIGEGK